MTTAREALARTVREAFDASWTDEREHADSPDAITDAILASERLKDHDRAIREGIATAIEADSISQWGHVTAGARPYAAIARTCTQEVGE